MFNMGAHRQVVHPFREASRWVQMIRFGQDPAIVALSWWPRAQASRASGSDQPRSRSRRSNPQRPARRSCSSSAAGRRTSTPGTSSPTPRPSTGARSSRSRPPAPGVRLCEHLPLLARQAHHLAVVNSVGATVNTNDHHAGYYYNLTGPRSRPELPDPGQRPHASGRRLAVTSGCVVASRRPPHPQPAQRHHPAAPPEQGPLHPTWPIRRPAGDRARPALRPRRPRSPAPVPGPGPDALRRRDRPPPARPPHPARLGR